MDEKNRQRMETMTVKAYGALVLYLDGLDALQSELYELEGKTCCGRVYWRDKNKPSKKAKLYAKHSPGQTCPLHGEGNDKGSDWRVYVGTDPDRQTQTLEAMALHVDRERLLVAVNQKQGALYQADVGLERFYNFLEYTVDDDGQPANEAGQVVPDDGMVPPVIVATDADRTTEEPAEEPRQSEGMQRVTAMLEARGMTWATSATKHVHPDDPMQDQESGRASYHIHPDASNPRGEDVERYYSLQDLENRLRHGLEQ